MRPLGYSTGALAHGDFQRGLRMIASSDSSACELSALREEELEPLVQALESISLKNYRYVSFHAPSRFETLTEASVVALLERVAARNIWIICHPDVIHDFSLWRRLGKLLVIENMDKRKQIGRTAHELRDIFNALPEAGFCLDVGHARQVDPTMVEAHALLTTYMSRLRQLHVSEVNSSNGHEPLTLTAMIAIHMLAHLLPKDLPAIIESPVVQDQLAAEMSRTLLALGDQDRNGPLRNGHGVLANGT